MSEYVSHTTLIPITFSSFFSIFYWNLLIYYNMPVNVVQHFSATDGGAVCVATHLKYVFFSLTTIKYGLI